MSTVWLYTLGSTILVSFISLIGVFTLGFKTKQLKKIVILLVSLSGGALIGDAFIHILPEVSEEFGFVGAVVVIGLLLFIIFRCLRTARMASDTFGALIAYGVATLLTFQAVVNIGMNLNLVPVTGLVLPFVSYGGSSLLSMLIGIGLVESVILRHKALEF